MVHQEQVVHQVALEQVALRVHPVVQVLQVQVVVLEHQEAQVHQELVAHQVLLV